MRGDWREKKDVLFFNDICGEEKREREKEKRALRKFLNFDFKKGGRCVIYTSRAKHTHTHSLIIDI